MRTTKEERRAAAREYARAIGNFNYVSATSDSPATVAAARRRLRQAKTRVEEMLKWAN